MNETEIDDMIENHCLLLYPLGNHRESEDEGYLGFNFFYCYMIQSKKALPVNEKKTIFATSTVVWVNGRSSSCCLFDNMLLHTLMK